MISYRDVDVLKARIEDREERFDVVTDRILDLDDDDRSDPVEAAILAAERAALIQELTALRATVRSWTRILADQAATRRGL